MKKILTLALLAAVFALAGVVWASMTSSGTLKGERLWSSPDVRASVIYKSGDTVSIYNAAGNIALCVGDNIPIYRSPANLTGERRLPYTYSMSGAPDLAGKQLIGEVRIFRHFGDNYAFGKLVVGDANAGDVAAKPSKSCLKG